MKRERLSCVRCRCHYCGSGLDLRLYLSTRGEVLVNYYLFCQNCININGLSRLTEAEDKSKRFCDTVDKYLEDVVIGYLFIDNTWIPEVKEILSSYGFNISFNRAVFDAIITLYSEGKDVDLVSVRDLLRKRHIEFEPVDLVKIIDSPDDAKHARLTLQLLSDRK